MVHYKIVYFNARGRAEPIRYVLAQAGVQFDDERVNKEDWPKIKPTTPMGQLPVLHVDGKQIGQSMAIARFLAKEHGLVPKDSWQAAKADMLVDGVSDLFPNFRPVILAVMSGDEPKKQEAWTTFKTDTLPNFLNMYEKFLTENGGKFLVGDHLSWVDLVVGEFLERCISLFDNESLVAGHKNLANLVKHVHELPNVKKYVDSRPKTMF